VHLTPSPLYSGERGQEPARVIVLRPCIGSKKTAFLFLLFVFFIRVNSWAVLPLSLSAFSALSAVKNLLCGIIES